MDGEIAAGAGSSIEGAEPRVGASSRDSLAAAGWSCARPGRYRELLPPRAPRFSWLRPSVLLESRNDLIARGLGDPTDELRRRWVENQRGKVGDDLIVNRSELGPFSFLVVGDPGEGDDSQYATVPPLLARADGTAFMVVCSDVVYPAGDGNQYVDKFYRPYKDYPAPIYALPGNHDWYDGLTGFMLHFCEVESPPPVDYEASGATGWRDTLRRILWRPPARPDPEALARGLAMRARPEHQLRPEHRQPGPYWAMDTGPLRIVSIDTGITGSMDRDQLEWLRAVSASSSKPKLLLTGRPLYVNGDGPVRSPHLSAVDRIVRAPEHRYVAAIGGDVHNYQRYPVRTDGERTIQYIVSGAGGAYMSATHKIPLIDLPGVKEEDFRCYPLRGDSLSAYSKVYDRLLTRGRGLFFIPPDEAAAIVREHLGLEPRRDSARRMAPSRRSSLAARLVAPLPGQRGYNPWLSELLDWNDPPLFKSFLRLDASTSEVRIRCFAATGCAEHEDDPPVEDEVRISLSSP
ncbi:MAG: metallophosphoesterase [Thermoleophilaceae bacterium]|nr:metallophosphoesterase [Thermoleophilaceae bacterium]